MSEEDYPTIRQETLDGLREAFAEYHKKMGNIVPEYQPLPLEITEELVKSWDEQYPNMWEGIFGKDE